MTTKTYTGRLTQVISLAKSENKEVLEAVIDFPRRLTPQIVDAGSAIAVYPQNLPDEVDTVIVAFGWAPDELLGNFTIRELLTTEIDIRTRKMSSKRLL